MILSEALWTLPLQKSIKWMTQEWAVGDTFGAIFCSETSFLLKMLLNNVHSSKCFLS